jgi:hypothetical protein
MNNGSPQGCRKLLFCKRFGVLAWHFDLAISLGSILS